MIAIEHEHNGQDHAQRGASLYDGAAEVGGAGGTERRMEFKELTNEQWASIQPLLPPPAHTGRPRADDRTVTNAILYVLSSGCRWADLPPVYGSGKTAWRRYKHLRLAGVWARMIESLGY